MDAVPWRQAWQVALYGRDGFYRGGRGPAAHFTTATEGDVGRLLAEALWAWADAVGADGIVDVGAGRGELLGQLSEVRPGRPLTGVDVVPRPGNLPVHAEWLVSPGGARLPDDLAPRNALVVAHEWLDVVPCTVAEVTPDGTLREVLVDVTTGEESLGAPLDGPDLQWCQGFWPTAVDADAAPGDRVEVGRQRDLAWEELLARMSGGTAIAVDYGHRAGDRPPEGTFTAYRRGVQVTPLPDGSCDLTAHVAVDSLRSDELLSQRDALRRVGMTGRTPDYALSRRDPAAYLAALGRTSAAAELLRRDGFGGFWWVVAAP
jgi:SAM-dependent MidA family methyltransferase